MSLRRKTLLYAGVTILCLLVIMYFASSMVIRDSFKRLEEQSVRDDITRVTEALNAELTNLKSHMVDYSAWDDMAIFVMGEDESFPATNLNDETWFNLRVNVVLIKDCAGKTVFARQADLVSETVTTLSPAIISQLEAYGLLECGDDPYETSGGVAMIDEEPMLVAAHPVVTSEFEGPAQGMLLYGRKVDESELQRLSEMTKFTVKLNTPAVSNIPADASIVIREVNSRTISGLGVVNDIEGNPALILRIDEPRRIYQQGQMTLIILIISLAVVGVIFAVVMLFPLENMLLRRLTQLHRNVQQAGTPGSSRACLDETGNDELSSLAVEINRMMSALEKTEKELRVSERRNILDAIPDILLVITASGTILEVKSDQDFFLDIPVEELNGRNIRDLGFSEEIIGQIDTAMRQALATEKVQTFELDIRLAKEYHYEFRMVALTGDEILVIGRDITERKRAEALLVERNTALQTSQKALKASAEALRISEERYALAMQGANDGLWDWDLKANRIYYSPRWKTMLGLAGDDIKPIPREWLSRVHPEDVDGVRRGLSNHLRGLTSHFESEYRILHKDGTYRWVLSRGIAVWEKPVKETSPDGVTVRGNGKTRKEDSSFNKGIENALRIAGSQTDISRTENWRSSSCCTMPSMTP